MAGSERTSDEGLLLHHKGGSETGALASDDPGDARLGGGGGGAVEDGEAGGGVEVVRGEVLRSGKEEGVVGAGPGFRLKRGVSGDRRREGRKIVKEGEKKTNLPRPRQHRPWGPPRNS